MTVMLDTNVYDKLILDKDACCLLEKKVQQGLLKIFCTSVQINELKAIPDVSKRSAVLSLLKRFNIQKLFVEYAPYGTAYGECYGGLSSQVRIPPEEMVTSLQQIPDAMIGLTASSKKYDIEFVVTEDPRFLRKMNKRQQTTKAVTFDEFVKLSGTLTTESTRP